MWPNIRTVRLPSVIVFLFSALNIFPAGGAFQPPPESGLAPSHNDWADGVTVNPYYIPISKERILP